MENGQNPTAPISYSVPEIFESTTAEEAATTLKGLQGARLADKNHPLNKPGHPQRKDFIAAQTRLFEIKNPEPEKQTDAEGQELVSQFPPDVVKAMGEGLELKANQNVDVQEERISKAETEMAKLVELGYENSAIPDDISERQIDVLTMQRMSAEGDMLSLKPMLSKNLRDLQVPQDVQQMFQMFCDSNELDKELQGKIAEDIIGWVNEARKQKESM